MAYLHGIEIIEVDSGGRTITTPSTSVIGIVGTASVIEGALKSIDEVLPLNKPVLFTNVAQITELGLSSEGSIVNALKGIYNQANTLVVVLRVAEGESIDETIKNMAGDVANYSGVYALMLAEAQLKYKPKLLICPYYSSILTSDVKPNAIVNSLLDVAEKLRGVAIIDGPNSSRGDAIDFAGNINSSRAMVIDPSYKPAFVVEDSVENLSSSALLAGVFASNDATKGFWFSPSNTAVKGVSGLSRPISFALSDSTSDSNLMNEAGVTTIVFIDGSYRIWGSRSPSSDSKWNFINVRRTVDTIYDALEKSMIWAMGQPISANVLDDIQNNVNSYLSSLVMQGALLGGQCWIDAEKNTPEKIAQGHLIASFDLEPPAALERLTFEAYRNDSYYETIFN